MIDHDNGPFLAKSYTKMAPKLARALKATDPAKSTSLSTKLRHHAGSYRLAAGQPGKDFGSASGGWLREGAKADREKARMLTDGVGSMGRRNRKVLP